MSCLFPMMSYDKIHPCGNCPSCKKRRTDSWIFRVYKEIESCDCYAWIRLSYADWHLRFARPSGLATIAKRDFQLFMKRLRHFYPEAKLRYFACGEYGSVTQRPHYHAFILNAGRVDDVYFEDALRKSWVCEFSRSQMGDIYIDPRPISESCIAYTTGYMNKKRFVFRNSRCGRVPEFLLMSKKLGLSYLTPEIIDWHRSSIERAFVSLNGQRYALPRYYSDKIFDKDFRDGHPDFFEQRDAAIDKSVGKVWRDLHHAYVLRHGNDDGFAAYLEESRKQSVINSQERASLRKG